MMITKSLAYRNGTPKKIKKLVFNQQREKKEERTHINIKCNI